MKQKLNIKYREWAKEIEEKCPEFLSLQYSNPYYIAVPDSWCGAAHRILIVGQEGHGTWGCGKGAEKESEKLEFDNIEEIQKFNKEYVQSQLGFIHIYKQNNSAFWKRFREIAKYADAACAWSNIDKIHILGTSKCYLSEEERKKLHSVNTRILQEEIDILQPTHVVFFGFYGISLQHECPEVFRELYINGDLNNRTKWFKQVVPILHRNRWYIFSYHPAWGYRKKGYEEKVIKVLEECMK